MTNKDIVRAAWKIYKNPPQRLVDEWGWCLMLARLVLEEADPTSPKEGAWLARNCYKRADSPFSSGRSYWARDFEKTSRHRGLDIPASSAEPGTVVCVWNTAAIPTPKDKNYPKGAYEGMPRDNYIYVGHVGIIVAEGVVLENINPDYRTGRRFDNKGAISLSDFSQWAAVTTYINFV